MNHFIPLDQAKKMTALYRQQKENILSDEYKGKDILSFSETFDAEAFRTLLSKEGCKSLRIYFGMDDGLKIHLITVGVNVNDEEMLAGDDVAIEEGATCPPICPPPPPPPSLNYD
jgi:hypothetical protein